MQPSSSATLFSGQGLTAVDERTVEAAREIVAAAVAREQARRRVLKVVAVFGAAGGMVLGFGGGFGAGVVVGAAFGAVTAALWAPVHTSLGLLHRAWVARACAAEGLVTDAVVEATMLVVEGHVVAYGDAVRAVAARRTLRS